jgi:hypothetical protein
MLGVMSGAFCGTNSGCSENLEDALVVVDILSGCNMMRCHIFPPVDLTDSKKAVMRVRRVVVVNSM